MRSEVSAMGQATGTPAALRVLLLEPDASMVEQVAALLDHSPGRPALLHAVSLLGDAVKVLHDESHDVIITELDLPDSLGLATLDQLVLAVPRLPIVVITRTDDEASALELLKHGAQDYLVRHATDGALLRKVLRYAIERKESAQHLLSLAQYDRLTGLANRDLFRDRLRQAMARAERSGRSVAVMFLDLDRFKSVNDSLGHLAGDELLVEIAGRLQESVRRTDTIARLGGDEFTVILEGLNHPHEAEMICRNILRAVAEPVLLQRHEIYISTSIGVTFFPGDDTDINALIRNADAAMYRAKEEGRNRYHLFTADINARAVRRLALESALRHASERRELHLCYQPKVDLTRGVVIGAEALLRWHSPEHGVVSPVEFIPVAEESGLIVPIGEWVLEQACQDLRAWRHAGFEDISVAVNLSARQFRYGDLVNVVTRALAGAGVPPGRLELEITESLLMDDTEASQIALRELKALGTSLFLDDFGTGYSSLAYLKKFPLDGLKIDRSFVNDLPGDLDDEAITGAILALGKALRLEVVAEGVETGAQADYLRNAGCELAQGYHFSPPLRRPDFLTWLREFQR